MTDFAANSYQDFSFGVQQGYREGVTNVWSGSMSNMTSDQSHDVQGGVEKGGSRDWNNVLKCSSSEPADSAFSNTDRHSEGRQVLGETEVTGTVLNTKL